MFLACVVGGANAATQMNLLTGHFGETFALNKIHETSGGPVVEEFGRFFWDRYKFDLDRVSFVCPDCGSVVSEGKSSWLMRVHQLFEIGAGDRAMLFVQACQKFIDPGPAFWIKGEANFFRSVFQNQAEKTD